MYSVIDVPLWAGCTSPIMSNSIIISLYLCCRFYSYAVLSKCGPGAVRFQWTKSNSTTAAAVRGAQFQEVTARRNAVIGVAQYGLLPGLSSTGGRTGSSIHHVECPADAAGNLIPTSCSSSVHCWWCWTASSHYGVSPQGSWHIFL